MTLKVFESFAGIGTQRMALRNLGIDHDVVAISEIDRFAIQSYEAIHGETNNLGNISKIDINDIPDHDLFTYSFPCQDISDAGMRKGFEKNSGTRSSLLWECERVIDHKRPTYLLMENVKALINKHHRPHFEQWLALLESYGYTNYWQVLNAKDYGIPQNRERVFCLSILGDHDPYVFPEPFELKLRLRDVLEPEVDEMFYLREDLQNRLKQKLNTATNENCIAKIKTKTGWNRHKTYSPNGIAPTLTSMQGGGTQPNVAIFNGSFNKFKINQKGISNSLTTVLKDNYVLEYDNQIRIRRLTPLECWRLMGISDEDFYKAQAVNSNTQLYKQAGNAIVVDVLEHIFKGVF